MSQPSTDRQALLISGALHGALVGLAVLVGVVTTAFKTKETLDFELVEADTYAMEAQSAAAPPAAEPTPTVSKPDFAKLPQIRPVELPPIPDPIPEPAPDRTPDPKPTPKPDPVVKPKPTPPKPEAKPEPKPERISYQQFVKDNPQKPKPQAKPTTAKPAQPVRIQSGNLTERLKSRVGSISMVGATGDGTGTAARAVASWGQKVRERLQAAFQPLGTSGLTADVEFTVTAGGQFTGARIVRSSGDVTFDRSVLDTFKNAQSPGASPDGKPHTWKLTLIAE